ncbi:MAG: carbohydrate kinase [Clostridia bacterium]|nr:carbohydrate kinase [Clostridia bacterium]
MFVGGLDIGTSGCKLVLYDEKGEFSGSFYKEYDVKRENGLHVIDAEEIFASVCHILSLAADKKILSIAVTSFGETFAMLDENDKPLLSSMLYTDPRGKEECAELIEKFGADNLAYKTGAAPHEMYSIPKIMWIKNNLPAEYKKAKHILLVQDYIVYMLSGVCQIDYSLAARTICFDIKNKCWADEILDFCGVDKNLLSVPVPSGTIAGNIKKEVAEKLGLDEDIKIVSGCHDQIAAMTGAKAFECDEVMDGTGTVECVPVIMEDIPKDFSLFEKGYSFAEHINGKYACYVLSYAGGATLKWFRDNLSDKSYPELDKMVKDRPSDLMIMPHFAGAATPYMDSKSKAAIIGLTFEHGLVDIYKALMEGTAYEIRLNLEIMKNYGIEPKMLIATGGGARSDVWLQIKADVLNIPVAALDGEEIGGAGTAYLAGRAVGIYDGMRLTNERKVFYPNEEKHKFYNSQFEKYKKIYSSVRELC